MKYKAFIFLISLMLLISAAGCGQKASTNISDTEISISTADEKNTTTDTNSDNITRNESSATTTAVTSAQDAKITKKSTIATQVVKTTKKPTTGATTKQQTPVTAPQPTSQWDLPAQGNEELLKQRIIYYVNEYRTAEGKPTAKNGNTPKMQQYANLRTQDLLTDFSHNNDKTQAAKDKAQLGKPITIDESYFDVATNQVVYTGKTITHYNGICGEAIGFDGGTQNIDFMAQQIARGYYESKSHWAYVGGQNATNICVGVKFEWNKQLKCNGWFSVVVVCADSNVANNET